jgi:hypothetical protein
MGQKAPLLDDHRLAAFGEPAEMARHAPLFEADGLAALGADFTHQAAALPFGFLVFKKPLLQHAGDGIGDGEHQSPILKTGCSPPIPLSCSTTLSTVTPDRKARETSRPMASVLAVVDRPDLPMVAKTSKGLPWYSVTVT